MPTDYGLKTPPLFSIIAKPLEKLTLTIKRTENAKPIKIEITADKSDYIDATQRSVRTILMDSAQDKRYKVGYIHLWHFASRKITQVFYDALKHSFKDCDGLIIDLRGRGGYLNIVHKCFAVLGEPGGITQLYKYYHKMPRFKKPVVLLTDEQSRSGKEFFAYYFKREQRGLIVGRNTTGAGIATRYYPLPDGSYLELPVRKLDEVIDNYKIEAQGVPPDILVKKPYYYCAGEDPILKAGKNALLKLMQNSAR